MPLFTLDRSQTALLIVDMQAKVFASVERSVEALEGIFKIIKGFEILGLPMLISEQYPQGLGETLMPIKTLLGKAYQPWIKSTFSCLDDEAFAQHLSGLPYQQWVVVGIEAHICVLQTVKGLLQRGKQVTVLNDAIASRSIYDFSTAIAEMRDEGARISCVETVLFELLKDSRAAEFKSLSQLIKSSCCANA
ncbi:isochorismatase family protein [Candidatus Protochlamydia phocaeensis]|uniref:isochorismatase family protein n=1 Tax=Candidatus Protochlamydia phocaeensis TaxID=1414722 RepID=UPI00083809AE|nr:isochorismatase family protein [Candidatus Protochlamydia phocaeensis]